MTTNVQRREGFHKYTDPGSLIKADDSHSAAFIPEQERFIRDVADEERQRMDEAAAKRAAELLRRREEAERRDERRWQRMEEEKRLEEERVQRIRAEGTKVRCDSCQLWGSGPVTSTKRSLVPYFLNPDPL